MENKKKTFPKALIIVLSVVSLIAMLSLSAFAASYGNTYSGSINGQGYFVYQDTNYSFNNTMSYHSSANDDCSISFDNSNWLTLYGTQSFNLYLISGATFGTTELHNGDTIRAYSQNDYDITFNVVIVNPQPLEKTYSIQFYNNGTYFSNIKINGISTDETNFSSISTIKYGSTIVYENDAWVTGYSSVLNYTSDVAPSLTTINTEANGIVTFTSQYQEPDMWDSVFTAVPTLLDNIGSTATSIVNNEYLALFCLVLPLISLAVGLLIRMRDRT